MNKTALKNFATWSRRKLIEQVQMKAFLYGIDEKNGLLIEEQFGQLVINGKTYPLSMKSSFTALQKQLEQKGYKQLLEEVAYTWFNRIIAIRYMEVHEYLPEKVNVLSSSVGRVDPDILFEFDTMDLAIDETKVRELVNTGDTEAAFRLLFVAQCNALNTILPFMFEKIQDYTELLLPDFLLDAESVIKTLVQSEDLTESFEEIEVIGWLYQYYIAEEKDRVFAQKSKYKKEEIPFATQLFTPKWIVQYMVQNSLGRYWTEAHREDEDLIDKWEYFIKHEEEDFHEKIAPYVNKELKVEDIKLLDPAMGSGHILVYAFEVFHEIYEKCGYPEREIPRLILENNLYGLDIDDRAYQLASFAVVMKAASYSKRFLRSVEREGIQLNLASIQETNHISDEVIAYIAQEDIGEKYNQVKAFFEQYYNAKTYGSLINITKREITFLEERSEQIVNNPVEDLFYGEQHEIAKQVIPALIHQTKIMRNKYDVLVMNPPYMGASGMSKELSDFVKKYYADSKSDLFAAFIERGFELLKEFGFNSMVTMQSWMFLSSYEKLREKIIRDKTISSLLHMDNMVMGIAFGTSATVFRNVHIENLKGIYTEVKYKDLQGNEKPSIFPIPNNRNSIVGIENFRKISGNPIAFWASNRIFEVFEKYKPISSIGEAKAGMTTGDNNRFLRMWSEVVYHNIGIGYSDAITASASKKKWFPYNKGGGFRKWYGLNEMVVFWENNGEQIKKATDNGRKIASVRSERLYFKKSITWATLTSGLFSCRKSELGHLFDDKGSSAFIPDELFNYILGMMNSIVCEYILGLLNPTISFQSGNIGALPICIDEKEKQKIYTLVESCVEYAKEDWNSTETSWDFIKHPLLQGKTIQSAYINWQHECDNRFSQLKANEEELNRIFIEIYGLQEELAPEVEDKNVTVRKADLQRDIKSFISYAVGCMFGRYSLDVPGLAYAGGEWDECKYSSFQPSKNGVIHFTDTVYFEDDIILRLREFLKVAFSVSSIEENMQWIAEALEMKNGEDAEARIRRYFMDEFFTDHCKIYQKRPIYWLVDSGKQKGLRTLIYMHRYEPDTMATIRFEHLQEIQAKYQQEIADLESRLVNPNLSATDKKKLNAEKLSFEKKIDELREFDKRLAAIAAEEIEIDLDDGVKVNYEKFYRSGKGVLAKIK